MTPDEIYAAIQEERARQDAKRGVGFHGRSDSFWLTILAEEFGEVARAILEREEEHTAEELIQVAAVVFSWLEFRSAYGDQPSLARQAGLSGKRRDNGSIQYA